MSDLQYLPISYLEENQLLPLMYEEEGAWMADLCWDYASVRQILSSFVRKKLLPGYAAVSQNEAIAYTYFLVNQTKGIIGAMYASKLRYSQEAVDELISLTVASLKDTPNIKRVEAQIMPFNNLSSQQPSCVTDSIFIHAISWKWIYGNIVRIRIQRPSRRSSHGHPHT